MRLNAKDNVPEQVAVKSPCIHLFLTKSIVYSIQSRNQSVFVTSNHGVRRYREALESFKPAYFFRNRALSCAMSACEPGTNRK